MEGESMFVSSERQGAKEGICVNASSELTMVEEFLPDHEVHSAQIDSHFQSMSIADVAARVGMDADRLYGKKLAIQTRIEVAVAQCASLAGSVVEVVGSAAIRCDIPQSDLDIVIATRSRSYNCQNAVPLLTDLSHAISNSAQFERVELRVSSRVPILVLLDANGISCDISVDQIHALGHRDMFREQLQGRPEIRSFIRMVKFWMHRRGLPKSAEGGVPSLAWMMIALRVAQNQPHDASIETLLSCYFFEMHLLRTMHLNVRNEASSPSLEWQRRSSQSSWQAEWIQFMRVDDPTLSTRAPSKLEIGSAHEAAITPRSIPTALAALYAAEFDIAWKAVRKKNWDDFLKQVPRRDLPIAPLESKSNHAELLHIFLKDGIVHVGCLMAVSPSPRAQQQDMLHRMDSQSVLSVRHCDLEKSKDNVGSFDLDLRQDVFSAKPCHWVCSLNVTDMQVHQGDGLSRLDKVKLMIKSSQLSSMLNPRENWQGVDNTAQTVNENQVNSLPRLKLGQHSKEGWHTSRTTHGADASHQQIAQKSTRDVCVGPPKHKQTLEADATSSDVVRFKQNTKDAGSISSRSRLATPSSKVGRGVGILASKYSDSSSNGKSPSSLVGVGTADVCQNYASSSIQTAYIAPPTFCHMVPCIVVIPYCGFSVAHVPDLDTQYKFECGSKAGTASAETQCGLSDEEHIVDESRRTSDCSTLSDVSTQASDSCGESLM